MRHMQIAFFVTEQSIITVRHGHSKGVEKVWNLTTDSPLYENGLNTALKVMRTSSNLYLEQILLFEAKVTDLEDALQKNGNDKMMAELVTFRSRLVKLRRIFNYHKSISQGLSSDQASRSPYVTKDNAHEIIDLQDIFERLFSLSQMHYDICGDLLDGYLSISSHQLNVTMRVLTVITAVFVPLSFLAGLYGMNFDSIPELHWEYGYFILLGVMFTLAVGLIYIFKRKNWM